MLVASVLVLADVLVTYILISAETGGLCCSAG
jgi:hypothetical protein